MGRFAGDSVSASHQYHISALCHPRSLTVTHGPILPWGCSEPRLLLGEASQVKSPLSASTRLASCLAREGALLAKKWSLFPLVEPGDQSSAWQDTDALVCSAVFARGYLLCPVWVEVNQSKVRASHHLPSLATLPRFLVAAWQAPGTLSFTEWVGTLGSSGCWALYHPGRGPELLAHASAHCW